MGSIIEGVKRVILNILAVCILCVCLLVIVWHFTGDSAHGKILRGAASLPISKTLVKTLVGKAYSANIQDTEFDAEELYLDENTKQEDYINIILFGIDSRKEEIGEDSRSDSMIILSLNKKNGEMKMVSLYRDTYLQTDEKEGKGVYNKCNAAFANGGAEKAISMINKNLDLDITDYITVNFFGLTNIVNLFGGIDVTITEEEMGYINKYVKDMTRESGLSAPELKEAGKVHLDGVQATAYCRIRYVSYFEETKDENGVKKTKEYKYDFGRTARQRNVLKKLVAKAKKMNPVELLSIANEVLNMNDGENTLIRTSLTCGEVTELLPYAYDFNLAETEGFPFEKATPTVKGASLVVAKTLESNVVELHEFLFEDYFYQVSDQVKEINDYIEDYIGRK